MSNAIAQHDGISAIAKELLLRPNTSWKLTAAVGAILAADRAMNLCAANAVWGPTRLTAPEGERLAIVDAEGQSRIATAWQAFRRSEQNQGVLVDALVQTSRVYRGFVDRIDVFDDTVLSPWGSAVMQAGAKAAGLLDEKLRGQLYGMPARRMSIKDIVLVDMDERRGSAKIAIALGELLEVDSMVTLCQRSRIVGDVEAAHKRIVDDVNSKWYEFQCDEEQFAASPGLIATLRGARHELSQFVRDVDFYNNEAVPEN